MTQLKPILIFQQLQKHEARLGCEIVGQKEIHLTTGERYYPDRSFLKLSLQPRKRAWNAEEGLNLETVQVEF